MSAGKGSAPRSNNSKAYLRNYDAIFRKKKRVKIEHETTRNYKGK
jgi:hypothetical protein